jgi:hypothetical protein
MAAKFAAMLSRDKLLAKRLPGLANFGKLPAIERKERETGIEPAAADLRRKFSGAQMVGSLPTCKQAPKGLFFHHDDDR